MTKNRGILVSVLATFLLIGCSLIPVGPATVGSGRAVSEQRQVGSFSKVRVGTAIQATVLVGPDASVSVTADDNLLSSVSTDVTAGRLTVMIQGNSQPLTPVTVQITVPSLDSIEATARRA